MHFGKTFGLRGKGQSPVSNFYNNRIQLISKLLRSTYLFRGMQTVLLQIGSVFRALIFK